MTFKAVFQQPVEATLWVHPAHGKPREATDEDIRAFDLRTRTYLYDRYTSVLEKMGIKHREYTEGGNTLRYIIECITYYDEDLDPGGKYLARFGEWINSMPEDWMEGYPDEEFEDDDTSVDPTED